MTTAGVIVCLQSWRLLLASRRPYGASVERTLWAPHDSSTCAVRMPENRREATRSARADFAGSIRHTGEWQLGLCVHDTFILKLVDLVRCPRFQLWMSVSKIWECGSLTSTPGKLLHTAEDLWLLLKTIYFYQNDHSCTHEYVNRAHFLRFKIIGDIYTRVRASLPSSFSITWK